MKVQEQGPEVGQVQFQGLTNFIITIYNNLAESEWRRAG